MADISVQGWIAEGCPTIIERGKKQFDNVWIGKFCKECGRREYCSDPIK